MAEKLEQKVASQEVASQNGNYVPQDRAKYWFVFPSKRKATIKSKGHVVGTLEYHGEKEGTLFVDWIEAKNFMASKRLYDHLEKVAQEGKYQRIVADLIDEKTMELCRKLGWDNDDRELGFLKGAYLAPMCKYISRNSC